MRTVPARSGTSLARGSVPRVCRGFQGLLVPWCDLFFEVRHARHWNGAPTGGAATAPLALPGSTSGGTPVGAGGVSCPPPRCGISVGRGLGRPAVASLVIVHLLRPRCPDPAAFPFGRRPPAAAKGREVWPELTASRRLPRSAAGQAGKVGR